MTIDPHHPQMSAEEFRSALNQLNFAQRSFSKFIDVNERTVRHWALGKYPIPRLVALLLNLMLLVEKTFHNPEQKT